MGYSLGIDFGTSTTKVAIRQGDQIPQPLPIGSRGELFMPSVVAYRRNKRDMAERIAIGEDALAVAETEETCVIQEIKRFFKAPQGTQLSHRALPLGRYKWWNPETGRVEMWSSTYSPYAVAMTIMEEALERAVRRAQELGFGKEIDKFSIRGLPCRTGCSVVAGLDTRLELTRFVRHLGFPTFTVDDLCEEPILASLSYVHQQIAPGETILVYDLGGGTFDTAVVKVHEETPGGNPVLTVFSADGESRCGGADIDEALFRHVALRIAEEHLGLEEKDRHQIYDRMKPDEAHLLRIQARALKEQLSAEQAGTIVLLPGFLQKDGLTISVTRGELERVVERTTVIEDTIECVLRSWRKARMLLRKRNEAVSSFYLQHDSNSGCISGPVTKLEHQDLRNMVDRVLVVGGTTRMPIVRQKLASYWGNNKLSSVQEEVVDPIEMCAVGAAWQQEETNRIVDRLPFSIKAQWGSEGLTLYRAFEEIVIYRTLGQTSISPFQSERFSLPKDSRAIEVVYETPDGKIDTVKPLQLRGPGPYQLRIDMFARCVLRDGLGNEYELSIPCQHKLQKEQCDILEEERRRKEQEDKERFNRTWKAKPGEARGER